jgi:hypothetical protein
MTSDAIEQRRSYSESKLKELRERIPQKVAVVNNCPRLCIYATGSFARLDAGQHSDLDLFFVTTPGAGASGAPSPEGAEKREWPAVTRIQETLIKADLIRLGADMALPEFSGDGQYLVIHARDDLVNHLGSQTEDYENLFTARLLLLLESTPLWNELVYDEVVTECVNAYYRDFHDHAENFRPVFFANDIVRFWKTLCLNYEHKRNRKEKGEEAKRKSHLKNFKLKFSRLLTCFSMVACLCDKDLSDHPDKAILLVKQTPFERLERLVDRYHMEELWRQMKELYAWFLTQTDRKPEEAESWIADREVRDRVFPEAKKFGDLMFQLLCNVAKQSHMDLRWLVV